MERISIFVRTTKKSGPVKLRFRLRDGREVDLYHTTDIKADLQDLEKFDDAGNVKPKISVYNKALKSIINEHIDAMHLAYISLCEKIQASHITGEMFEDAIELQLHPEKSHLKKAVMTVSERFEKYIADVFRDGIIQEGRMRHYKVVLGMLERFLTIKKLKKLTPMEFNADMIMDFRAFLINECDYVAKYSYLYEGKPERDIPTKPRADNTVITKLKMFQAFFNELEDKEEVEVSPFRKLGKKRKTSVMSEKYDDPIFLLRDEFFKVMNTEVPKTLQETKECFLLQCALGNRIGDFSALKMENLWISKNGILYIHYLAHKTINNKNYEEIETPVVLYALELIKKWKFEFPVLKYLTGKSGYNAKIKTLMEFCEIDRLVPVFNKKEERNDYVPLYTKASSKLCRKTNVDMSNKYQVNKYATGLHQIGSSAVDHYSKLSVEDKFILLSATFEQPLYTVDKNLNIKLTKTEEYGK